MKNVNPKISIIMTIYNHEKFLKKSIQSIINQSFRNWELVAVDNGSNDNSRKILNSINDKRLKILSKKTSEEQTVSILA